MWDVAEQCSLKSKAHHILENVNRSLGGNPFIIAADQGISVTLHDAQPDTAQKPDVYSQFRPDVLAIDIYHPPLQRFWDELFPGCQPHLKYYYACWRELWNYWMHMQFAPLKFVLGDSWLDIIVRFSAVNASRQEYLAQYFASLATGVLKYEA